MEITQLIADALKLSPPAIAYHISQQLAALYPDKGIVEGNDCSFNLQGFIQAQHCQVKLSSKVHNQVPLYWDVSTGAALSYAANAWLEVTWQTHQLEVLFLNWQMEFGTAQCYWILAETQAIAAKFFAVVCEWNTEIRDEVLVFENGRWAKSPELFHAIRSATLDNLILAGTLKQEILADLKNFFEAQSLYQEYEIPWKRGILLIGPPGNGKTHMVKALLNTLQKPCLYVKSFRSYGTTEGENMRRVFYKARQSAPCLLVLEDLDSLLNKTNRSFFLNELDGFALNKGIVTLATTNYPERLDPSILERPSRFDRKYHFDLPAVSERTTYIQSWNARLKPAMQLSEAAVAEIAAHTEGFSFAYLKELFLSAIMAWATKMTAGSMDGVMRSQVDKLREQMHSEPTEATDELPDEVMEIF